MAGPNNPKEPKKSGYYSGAGTGTKDYNYTDFTYVRRKRGIEIENEEEGGELNIVPYLDIIVNLIIFLLVVQATLVSLGLIDVSAPSYASLGVGDQDPTQDQKKPLRLTVGIAREGFFIAARGGVLDKEDSGTGELTDDGVERRKPTIPLLPNGRYNFPALKIHLRGIKDGVAREDPTLQTTALYVAADADTPYEVIVNTLDASREDPKGELFPAVAFTQIR